MIFGGHRPSIHSSYAVHNRLHGIPEYLMTVAMFESNSIITEYFHLHLTLDSSASIVFKMLQDNARPPSFSFRSLPGLAPTSLISISFISPCLRFYLPAKLSFCCLLSHKLFLAFQPWTICSLCQNPFVANSPARSRP